MAEVEEVGKRMEAQIGRCVSPRGRRTARAISRSQPSSTGCPTSTLSRPAHPSTRMGSGRGWTCYGAATRWSASSASSPLTRPRTTSPPPTLKYLLVPYYLGEMTEQVEQEDRIPVLKDELELSRQRQSDTAANRRAQKVSRFKRQKAAETKHLEIKERKERRRRSLRAAALSASIEAGEEDDLEDDGEEEIEVLLATISLVLCKALDLVDMLRRKKKCFWLKKKENPRWLLRSGRSTEASLSI